MNRKGFTMIELLMVIVIIGILSLIMIPNIVTIIEKNKVKNIESINNNIISAAKMYVNDNKYDMGFTCPGSDPDNDSDIKDIEINTLVNGGYLKSIPIDPSTKDEINKKVKVTFNCSNNTFSFSLD